MTIPYGKHKHKLSPMAYDSKNTNTMSQKVNETKIKSSDVIEKKKEFFLNQR